MKIPDFRRIPNKRSKSRRSKSECEGVSEPTETQSDKQSMIRKLTELIAVREVADQALNSYVGGGLAQYPHVYESAEAQFQPQKMNRDSEDTRSTDQKFQDMIKKRAEGDEEARRVQGGESKKLGIE